MTDFGLGDAALNEKKMLASLKHHGLIEKKDDSKASDKESKLTLINGRHYHSYIQSGENIRVDRIADEVYEFKIIVWNKYPKSVKNYCESFQINPETDLSEVSTEILEELAIEMGYCGEVDNDWIRGAKFSKTRKHIQSYYQ
jgi:hypothetical protein